MTDTPRKIDEPRTINDDLALMAAISAPLAALQAALDECHARGLDVRLAVDRVGDGPHSRRCLVRVSNAVRRYAGPVPE